MYADRPRPSVAALSTPFGIRFGGRSRSIAAALFTAGTAACAGGDTTDAAGRLASVTIPADSIHVLGTSIQIADIRDILPSSDGVAWVINSRDPFFVGFSPEGSVRHEWGRRGQGPQEFRSPAALVLHPESGDVWVYDRSGPRNSLIRVSKPDSAWTEVPLPADSLPSARLLYSHFAGSEVSRLWIEGSGDAFLFARSRPQTREVLRLWESDLVAVNSAGTSFRSVLPIGDLVGDASVRYDSASFLLPYPLWSVCSHDRSFALYDPLQNTVRRFGADVSEGTALRLPPERLTMVTREEVFRMAIRREFMNASTPPDTAALKAEFESAWQAVSPQFAKVFPEYVGLQCAADGSIWLQLFDVDSPRLGLGNEWLRVGPDGAYGAYKLPEEFTPIRFVGDRIWGVMRDEVGVASAAWLSLPSRESRK